MAYQAWGRNAEFLTLGPHGLERLMLPGAPVIYWVPSSTEEILIYVLCGGGSAQGEPGGRLSERLERTIGDLGDRTLTDNLSTVSR